MRRKQSKTVEACPKCEGSGYVVTADGASPCECLHKDQTVQALHRARIPKKFLGKSLAGFDAKKPKQGEIVTGVKNFIKTFPNRDPDHPAKGLLLRGSEGTGKTHIAVAALQAVIRKGYTGLYWSVPELFMELRRLMNGPSEVSEADLFDEARRVDLLVLDDLGAERASDYAIDRLYVLINGRYQNDTATLITTNLTLDELRSQVGPRIVSRICEMCVQVEFPPGDYRRQNLR